MQCAVPHRLQPCRQLCHEVAVPARQLPALAEARWQGEEASSTTSSISALWVSPCGTGIKGLLLSICLSAPFPLSHPCCPLGSPLGPPQPPCNDGF